MRRCVRSSNSSLVLILLLAAALLYGCAAGGVLKAHQQNPRFAALVLHSALDRWEQWRSLSAQVKLKINTPDAKARAKGHVLFLAGERYEVGFVKPYDRFIGNFYVTPQQFVYWDLKVTPMVYGLYDSLSLSNLIPATVPNWDPRDLLPFPVSGRSGGFQPDSVWRRDKAWYVSGLCGGARHTLQISAADGRIIEEVVARTNRDVIVKTYSRYSQSHNWPIARRVTCTDPARQSTFTWTLSGIALDAREFRPDLFLADTSNSGITP
jgi:hypothetical protein